MSKHKEPKFRATVELFDVPLSEYEAINLLHALDLFWESNKEYQLTDGEQQVLINTYNRIEQCRNNEPRREAVLELNKI